VLCADLALGLPDFRAAERTFQLLTQVAGRAGRGDVEGEVFVQSFTPFSPQVAPQTRGVGPGIAEIQHLDPR
jgi:primosomal protein N' (replication factor Y)